MEILRLRLKDFNAQKVAPNFLKFLSERGQVEVGNESEKVARYGMSNKVDLHKGLGKPVRLNGKQIGKLEVYIDPPAVVYQGELPDVPEQKRRGKQSRPGPQIDDSGVAWTSVTISYHGSHPKAEKEGRSDGWTKIPLP